TVSDARIERAGEWPAISALVKKQIFRTAIGMSALPPKAYICGATRDVRYGPKADICAYQIDVRPPYNWIGMSMSAHRMSLRDYSDKTAPRCWPVSFSSVAGFFVAAMAARLFAKMQTKLMRLDPANSWLRKTSFFSFIALSIAAHNPRANPCAMS